MLVKKNFKNKENEQEPQLVKDQKSLSKIGLNKDPTNASNYTM